MTQNNSVLSYFLGNCLTYLSPLCQLARRAATKFLHLHLSLAIFSMVPQLWCCRWSSFSIVLRHVILGLPFFLFPSGVQCNATLGIAFVSILSTWPIQVHLRLSIILCILSCWVMLRRLLFEMVFGQNKPRILHRHDVWKVYIVYGCRILWFSSIPFCVVVLIVCSFGRSTVLFWCCLDLISRFA